MIVHDAEVGVAAEVQHRRAGLGRKRVGVEHDPRAEAVGQDLVAQLAGDVALAAQHAVFLELEVHTLGESLETHGVVEAPAELAALVFPVTERADPREGP